ncbi:MAG: MCE family protein [Gammaproteobacteria bacterium]|nr:MCE family protein [Gammaproteobacteria bacterium]
MNEPVIEARSGLSVVWLIPLLTALLGGWLIVRALVNEGPLVALTFRTADGIEVGKTRIKYKSLDIGLVESVRFSADFSRVEVAARLSKEAGHFLRRDTRFWVVRPTLSARGISGLGTLLSGAYIEIEPGLGVPQTLFVGLESPPVVHAAEAGTQITLLARKLGSLDRGSLVHYQGLVAGEVLGYEMADDYHSVLIHAFVKPPFDQLVRSNTRFWSASGLDLSLGPDGVRLKTESLQALLFGGIAFDTPAGQDQAADDITGLVFTLHDDQQAIEALGYVQKVRFVLFFAGSVRGLNVGAPVEFKGIKVGAVTSVQLEYDDQTAAFRIPVVIELEPERIIERGESLKKAPREAFQALVKRGLRARLQTGNLLTGQLLVDLDMQPKSPLRLMGAGRAEPELPTVEGDFDQITTQLKGLVAKLDQLDIATIGGQLQATLKGTAAIANSPQIGRALEGLGASLASLRSILHKLDAHAEPLTTTLEQTLVAARDALEKSQAMMTTLEGVVAPESPLHDNVLRLTRDLSQTARALRGLVDTLERNPQSLLFGRQATDEAP